MGKWKGWLLLLYVPMLVMALRVSQNSLALGGFDLAVNDLVAAAEYRAGVG